MTAMENIAYTDGFGVRELHAREVQCWNSYNNGHTITVSIVLGPDKSFPNIFPE